MFPKCSASTTYHTTSPVFLPNYLDSAGTSEAAHCYIQKLAECVSFLCDLIWTLFTRETALSLLNFGLWLVTFASFNLLRISEAVTYSSMSYFQNIRHQQHTRKLI